MLTDLESLALRNTVELSVTSFFLNLCDLKYLTLRMQTWGPAQILSHMFSGTIRNVVFCINWTKVTNTVSTHNIYKLKKHKQS